MGIKIFSLFFISPRACFFICAVVIFRINKENCISYTLLFAIKRLMVSQFGDL